MNEFQYFYCIIILAFDLFLPVLRIRGILVRVRICGSVPLRYYFFSNMYIIVQR